MQNKKSPSIYGVNIRIIIDKDEEIINMNVLSIAEITKNNILKLSYVDNNNKTN